jgi:hypothetical protein
LWKEAARKILVKNSIPIPNDTINADFNPRWTRFKYIFSEDIQCWAYMRFKEWGAQGLKRVAEDSSYEESRSGGSKVARR